MHMRGAGAGKRIIPIPVFYPDCTEILGQPCVRRVLDVAGRHASQRQAQAGARVHRRAPCRTLAVRDSWPPAPPAAEPIDVLDVFRKPSDLMGHVEDILGAQHRPKCVWLQTGAHTRGGARNCKLRGLGGPGRLRLAASWAGGGGAARTICTLRARCRHHAPGV